MIPKRSSRGAAAPILLLQSVPLIAALAIGLGGCESIGLGEPACRASPRLLRCSIRSRSRSPAGDLGFESR